MFLYVILVVSLIFCLSFKTKRALHMLKQNLTIIQVKLMLFLKQHSLMAKELKLDAMVQTMLEKALRSCGKKALTFL